MGSIRAITAGAALALVAHSGKTALRTAVSGSPEPVSNIGLSLVEDASALTLAWFATQHPYVAATMVVVMMLILVMVTRWLLRAFRKLMARPLVAGRG